MPSIENRMTDKFLFKICSPVVALSLLPFNEREGEELKKAGVLIVTWWLH
jgi:hypothetical protein